MSLPATLQRKQRDIERTSLRVRTFAPSSKPRTSLTRRQKEEEYLNSPALSDLDRRIREQVQIGNMYIDLVEDKLRQVEAELANS